MVKEEAMAFLSFRGSEECFTTISLVDFAEKILENDVTFRYAQAQLSKNQDKLMMV